MMTISIYINPAFDSSFISFWRWFSVLVPPVIPVIPKRQHRVPTRQSRIRQMKVNATQSLQIAIDGHGGQQEPLHRIRDFRRQLSSLKRANDLNCFKDHFKPEPSTELHSPNANAQRWPPRTCIPALRHRSEHLAAPAPG